MQIEGPERYGLTFTKDRFIVLCAKGTSKFSGLATTKLPKLYVVSIKDKPVYVGLTKQSLRSRLRFGWSANGKGGYYGYAWRHQATAANLDIWCHMNAVNRNEHDIETVEAEVVFLIRAAGQWPQYQTEIHFHPSKAIHRKVAAKILAHYSL